MIRYVHPPGVEPLTIDGRPVLTVPRNGRVAIDESVLSLWTMAAGRTQDELMRSWPTASDREAWLPAALACLAEGRLLTRETDGARAGLSSAPSGGGAEPATRLDPPLVSAIVIAYDSQEWLQGCLGTLSAQRYPAIEPIVVDNASPEDPTPWIREHFPAVRAVRLPPGRSFAHAVNHGVSISRGQYALVLNPDIEMDPEATSELVRVAEATPESAAVAAKLTFWWAPAFLNGLGNRVEAKGWGTDNFIGHLDLGQFDSVCEVPSVCFAAALIRRSAWDDLGPADEAFPMYYEDVEWSYRARLAGYRLAAAPRASIAHVFGGKVRSGGESDLTPFKTRNAAYGRLRFAMKLLSGRHRREFLGHYLAEDRGNLQAAVAGGDWATAGAYLRAWASTVADLPALTIARRRLSARRRQCEDQVLGAQRDMPGGLMWHGMPDLSRETIANQYLPLLRDGHTRAVPELASRPVAAS